MHLIAFFTLIFISSLSWADLTTEAGVCVGDCAPQVGEFRLESYLGACPKDAPSTDSKSWIGKFLSAANPKEQAWNALRAEWEAYNQAMNLQIAANAKSINYNPKATFSGAPLEFLSGLEKLTPFIQTMDEMDKRGYLNELFKFPMFRKASQSGEFLDELRAYDFGSPTNDEIKRLLQKPQFKDLILKVQATLRDQEGFRYVNLMIENGLSVYDKASRVDALNLKKFMNSKGVTAEKIEEWKKNPPHFKEVPYPRELSGKVTESYRKFLQNKVEEYLTKNSPTSEEILAVKPDIKASEIEKIKKIQSPVEKNAYDDWIRPLHQKPLTAEITIDGKKYSLDQKKLESIDAVARTLWGEARGCNRQGLPQYEAIGRVIVDRSLAVQASLEERARIQKVADDQTQKFNGGLFGTGEQAVVKMQSAIPPIRKKGLSDFGRNFPTDPKDLDPAAQVISKPLQFSVWNSSLKERKTLLALNPQKNSNIPDVQIVIQKPQPEGDNNALLSVVCPDKKKFPDLWKKAVDVAALAVVDPQAFQKKYRFDSSEKEILFYTHAAELPFAKEVFADDFIIKDQKTSLRGKAKDTCGQLRLFVPRVGGQY